MARETTEEIERAMAEVSRAGLPVADLARITATLNADLTRGIRQPREDGVRSA